MNIALSQGRTAIIDDEDWPLVKGYTWYAHRCKYTYYVKADGPRPQRNRFYMHRLILPPPQGFLVDHINGDGLDNRKRNLRIVTHAQNIQNSFHQRGTSRFKGVCWYKAHEIWSASIKVNYESHFLGYFSDEMHAAEAYNAAAISFFGPGARLNEIPCNESK